MPPLGNEDLQAYLQAAQLAEAGGGSMPPASPIGQPPLSAVPGGQVPTYTRTVIPIAPGTSSQNTKKDLSPDALLALGSANQADAALLGATEGQPIDRTAEHAQVDVETPPPPPAAQPQDADPFQPSQASQAIDQSLAQVGGQPAAADSNIATEAPGKGEGGRYTLNQFGHAMVDAQPRTFEQAQDEANAYKAAMQAKLNVQREQDEAKLREKIEADRQRAAAEHEQLVNEYQKAKNITGFWEDKSVPQRVLMAIGNAMQTMAQYRVGHVGPTQLEQMWAREQAADLEAKRARLDQIVERLKIAGAHPAQLDAAYEAGLKRIGAVQQAQWNTVEAKANQMLAPFPQAQRQLQEKLAGIRAQMEQKKLELLARETGRTAESGKTLPAATQETVEGDKGSDSSRGLENTKGAVAYANAQENGKKADEMQKLLDEGHLPTPEQIAKVRDNQNKIMHQQEIESHSVPQSKLGEWGRSLNLIPKNIFDGAGMTPQQQKFYTLQWQLAEPQAIQATGGITWMNNPEAFRAVIGNRVQMPDEPMEISKMKAQQIIDETRAAAEETRRVSKSGRQEQRLEARAQTTTQRPALPPPQTQADAQQRLTRALRGDNGANVQKVLKIYQGAKVDGKTPTAADKAKAKSWLKERGLIL